MGTALRTPAKARSARKSTNGAETEEIARIAYELFERRGRVNGHDLQDWLEAERVVRQRRTRA